ncbi:MAG TPA: restriction endonuclease subunit S [Desulfosporosinus sp.]|nr:restriction endonuclease subunit S [Desulfosporosinus sp.]
MGNSFPNNWDFFPLEQCMELIIDYRGKTPRKTEFGVPLITAKVVKNGRIETDGKQEYIGFNEFDSWMRRGLPKSGDVVITTEAPLGEVAQLGNRRVALAQRLITLRGKKNFLDNTFLKYLLQSAFFQNQLKSRATGTTVIGIKQSELRKILLPIPPYKEQERIGNILGSLDGKIEINHLINQTLENILWAIFKSWFVNFEPVRARLEGRDTGLPAEIADMFPESFYDSPVGEIPSGWDILNFSDAFQINPFRYLKKGQEATYLDMQNMPTSGHRPVGWTSRSFSSGTRFINGDTLMARITPCLENGKTAFVDFLKDDEVGWGSTEYIVIRSKPPIPKEYSYFLARDDSFRAFAIRNMSGTSGRQRVQVSSFQNLKVIVAPKPILEIFGSLAHEYIFLIKKNSEESSTITQLRDLLLPKLLNGEIVTDTIQV